MQNSTAMSILLLLGIVVAAAGIWISLATMYKRFEALHPNQAGVYTVSLFSLLYHTFIPTLILSYPCCEGGAVAEWSKALLWREKIYENLKIPGSPPGLGTFKKNLL